jgi:hypothetical protein
MKGTKKIPMGARKQLTKELSVVFYPETRKLNILKETKSTIYILKATVQQDTRFIFFTGFPHNLTLDSMIKFMADIQPRMEEIKEFIEEKDQ